MSNRKPIAKPTISKITDVTVQANTFARDALKALANEDLIYAHHGSVCARDDAYKRLAMFFESYAVRRVLQSRGQSADWEVK